MRIRLGIMDQDEMYKMRLINYFSANYADKVEIFSFSDQQKLNQFLSENQLDVLLSDEESIQDANDLPKEIAFAYWSESVNIDSIRNIRTVCKYQKAELIYKEILSLYAELESNVTSYRLGDGSSCLVVSFMGAAGGVGASTAAAGCALRAARLGKKVLFLDLTQLGSTSEFFEGEGTATLSEALYAIKSNHSNLFLKLESMVRQDASGVNFYESCHVALDARDATGENIKMLIHSLAESKSYEMIVIDAESQLTPVQKAILESSGAVVLVSNGTTIANKKLQKLVESYKLDDSLQKVLRKTFLVYNHFHTGAQTVQGLDDIPQLGGVNVYKNASAAQIAKEISLKNIMDRLILSSEG